MEAVGCADSAGDPGRRLCTLSRMSKLAHRSLVLVSLMVALFGAGCGGGESTASTSATGTSGGDAAQTLQGAAVTVGFEVEATTPADAEIQRMNVTLVLADETGAVVREPVGELMACSAAVPTATTLLTLTCFWAGTGDALHVVREGDDVVLVREDLASELTEPARAEVRRWRLSAGAAVTAR